MINDLLTLKAATIERCVSRAREEYQREPVTFAANLSRQDAAILNIVRACDAALDMGQHLIRRECLGVPQSARDVFALLAQSGWIDAVLAEILKRMLGFRDIALHDDQALQLSITVTIIEKHLDEFLDYSRVVLLRNSEQKEGCSLGMLIKSSRILDVPVEGRHLSASSTVSRKQKYFHLHLQQHLTHSTKTPNKPMNKKHLGAIANEFKEKQ